MLTKNRAIIGSLIAAAAIAVWWYGRRVSASACIIADVNDPQWGEVVPCDAPGAA